MELFHYILLLLLIVYLNNRSLTEKFLFFNKIQEKLLINIIFSKWNLIIFHTDKVNKLIIKVLFNHFKFKLKIFKSLKEWNFIIIISEKIDNENN